LTSAHTEVESRRNAVTKEGIRGSATRFL
jgi:hypothetical protein